MSHTLFAAYYQIPGCNGAVALGMVIKDAKRPRTTFDGWRMGRYLTIVKFDDKKRNVQACRHSEAAPRKRTLIGEFSYKTESDEVIDRFEIREVLVSLGVEKVEELLGRYIGFTLENECLQGEIIAMSIDFRCLSLRLRDVKMAEGCDVVSITVSAAPGRILTWHAIQVLNSRVYDAAVPKNLHFL